MKNQRILHLMEHIDPAYIAEAAPKKKRGALSWQRWGSVAAAVVLLVGTLTGGYYIFQNGKENKIPETQKVSYMDYNGPVLPLTATERLDGITVDREVTYDFSGRETMVTDQYVLKNTKDVDQTISLLYPFGASLADKQKMIPQITVDGAAAETTLHPGAACKLKKNGTTGEKVGWDAYQTLLADGSYQATAFAASTQLQQSIVVYEFTNVVCEEQGENPTLNVEFEMDYHKTTVMTFGFNGAKNDVDKGVYGRNFSASEPETRYLIVLGEDLKAYTLQGYEDGGCDKGEEISITATVHRSESTLGAFIQERLEETHKDYGLEMWYAMPDEVLFKLVAQQLQEGILAQEGTEKFSFDMLDDAFLEVYNAQRVIYVAFDVTIPAGTQITVAGAFMKEAHSNYVVSGETRGYAYDLATQLGSNLTFTSQKVSASGMEQMEIKEQNFGFDLKNGVTQVTLNSEEPYYWMELQKVATPPETNTAMPTDGPKETPSMGPTPVPTPTEEPRDTHTVPPIETSTESPTLTPTLAPTKKPTATPAPTPTPEPTPIPPCTSGEDHEWGPWVPEKYYTLTEEGIDKTTCTICGAVKRRVEPVAPVFEAFGEDGLSYYLNTDEEYESRGVANCIAMFANNFIMNKYFVLVGERDFEVSSKEYFEEIEKRITLTDELKEELKKVTVNVNGAEEGIYNPQTDTFHYWDHRTGDRCDPKAYVHRGGDRYTVYFEETRLSWTYPYINDVLVHIWEVELTYCNKSRLDSEWVPNRILSFKEVDAIPEDAKRS